MKKKEQNKYKNITYYINRLKKPNEGGFYELSQTYFQSKNA